MEVTTANLLWLDLETTGLDPLEHCILEVGAILTDGELRELGRWSTTVYPVQECVGDMVPKVRAMHAANGLLAEAYDEGVTIESAQDSLIGFLDRFGAGRVHLAGSYPVFERQWLEVYMPGIVEGLHRRALDVNALWVLLMGPHHKPEAGHRAIPDLERDLDMARIVYETALPAFRARFWKGGAA